MLVSPGLSGQRTHRGVLTTGVWAPILSIEEMERLRAILLDPHRNTRGGAPRRYLLVGLAECGLCGAKLISRPSSKGRRRYVCAREEGRPGCGKIARQAEAVETLIRDMLIEATRGVDVSAFIVVENDEATDTLAAELRADREALEQLGRDYYVERLINRSEFFANRATLTNRIESATVALSRSARTHPLRGMVDVGREIAARWEAEPVEWRRAVVDALVDRVVISPAPRGSTTFDASAIVVAWKF
jgi:hypothetical protein